MTNEDRYYTFKVTGRTCEERVGEPDEYCFAIGRISISFSQLEESVTNAITCMMGAPDVLVGTSLSGYSFRAKVTLFESLVRECDRTGLRRFNIGNATLNEDFGELYGKLVLADELHRQVVQHSLWLKYNRGGTPVVIKSLCAPSEQGSGVTEYQEVDSSYLIDIDEFIMCLAEDVDKFMPRYRPSSEISRPTAWRSHPRCEIAAP